MYKFSALKTVKEIKEDLNKWWNMLCFMDLETVIKMSISTHWSVGSGHLNQTTGRSGWF